MRKLKMEKQNKKNSIEINIKGIEIIDESEIKKRTSAMLDFDHWGCLQVITIGKRLVIPQVRIKEKPGDPMNYCLQISGGGQYFKTLSDMNEYAIRRWGTRWYKTFKYATYDRLTERW